jgi:hypothetical protein
VDTIPFGLTSTTFKTKIKTISRNKNDTAPKEKERKNAPHKHAPESQGRENHQTTMLLESSCSVGAGL